MLHLVWPGSCGVLKALQATTPAVGSNDRTAVVVGGRNAGPWVSRRNAGPWAPRRNARAWAPRRNEGSYVPSPDSRCLSKAFKHIFHSPTSQLGGQTLHAVWAGRRAIREALQAGTPAEENSEHAVLLGVGPSAVSADVALAAAADGERKAPPDRRSSGFPTFSSI